MSIDAAQTKHTTLGLPVAAGHWQHFYECTGRQWQAMAGDGTGNGAGRQQATGNGDGRRWQQAMATGRRWQANGSRQRRWQHWQATAMATGRRWQANGRQQATGNGNGQQAFIMI